MKVEIIADADALRRLEPDWWNLFHRCPNATPFSSPAWLLPWWSTFAPGQLLTVAIRRDETLAALALLYVEDGTLGRRLLSLGIGLSDYCDVLVDPANAPEAGALLMQVLAEHRGQFDLWSAENVPPEAAALSLSAPAAWTSVTTEQDACPTLALDRVGGFEAAVPAAKQRKWRMARNRTARRAWHLRSTSPDTLSGDLKHLFRLHAARWTSRGEAGVLAENQVQSFHSAVAPKMLAAGLLHMLVLRIDGTVTGVYYGFRHRTAAYAYLGGFDPAFAFESPGTLLVGTAVREAADAGALAFHFLRGQEGYKYEWGAVDRPTFRRILTVAQ